VIDSSSSLVVTLMRLVDLAVVGVVVGALWVGFRRRLHRANNYGATGRWMIFASIGLMLFVACLELALQLSDPNVRYLTNPRFLFEHVPTPIFWLTSRATFLLLVFGALFALLERRRADEAFRQTQADMIRRAQESVLKLESRFVSLLDTTPNPVFCWAYSESLRMPTSVDDLVSATGTATIVECNSAYVASLGKSSMAETIGTRVTDLFAGSDQTTFRALIQAFVDADYSLREYELTYTDPDGRKHDLKMTLTGIVENERLVRVWGSQTDMRKFREAQSALRQRRDFQELVAGISSYMIMTPIEHSQRILEDCLKEVADFIDADNGSLLWIFDDQSQGSIQCRWTRTDKDIPDVVTEQQFPALGEMIRAGKVLRISDVSALGADADTERRLFESWGLKSLVSLPLTIAGELTGTINFSTNQRERTWSDQDILDLRVLAEMFANFVSRLNSQQALSQALGELSDAKERLEAENVYLRDEIDQTHGFDEIIGASPAILRTLRMVEMVASTDTPVLILGETGTGKELIARAIHQRSTRKDRPLVKVNCATLPSNLIESELFGYERGAFTGATQRKLGRFDLADGSTLFLDEFGELPLELQTKLLRVLQEGEFDRLGGTETISVDVRLIVATNQDLADAVRAGTFRSDLYYRVNTFPVNLPPLREREGDIELLAMHFMDIYATKMGRHYRGISSAMMRQLMQYDWPGNVRELEGVVQRAVIASHGEVLELPEPLVAGKSDDSDIKPARGVSNLKTVEREHIVDVLEASSWRISGPRGAAAKLGLPPSTLRSRMKKLEIAKPD